MFARVVVTREFGVRKLKSWWIDSGQGIREWDSLCKDMIVWSDRREKNSFEIFVCLVDDELGYRRDCDFIQQLLGLARERNWGAPIYVAASTDIGISPELVDEKASLKEWQETLLEGGITDLLQARYSPHTKRLNIGDPELDYPDHQQLQNSAARSRARVKILQKMKEQGPWRCIFRLEERLLGRLFHPWVQYDQTNVRALLLVIDNQIIEDQRALAELEYNKYPSQPFRIVTLRTSAQKELLAFCNEHGLDEPLRFRGEFELWFFLLKLNGFSDRPTPINKSDPGIQRVKPTGEIIFNQKDSAKEPRLLLTSAFSADDGDQALEAATDVGGFEALPWATPPVVCPNLNRDHLVRHLKAHPSIWVHMTHGNEDGHLQEYGGNFLPIAAWLDCFRAEKPGLKLVLLLTCHSHRMAEAFVQAGADVAIGFRGFVESAKTRRLAVPVLRAVVERGLSQKVVLEGFRRGYQQFHALRDNDARPIAFCRDDL